MSATVYLRAKLLDHLSGQAAYSPPTLYLSLHLSDPGVAGSHAFEVTGGGYVRQSLIGVMGAADADGISVNTTVITFGPATDDWGTVTFLGIEDAIAGGNMLLPGAPAMPRTVTSGQPFQIPPGKLRIRQS